MPPPKRELSDSEIISECLRTHVTFSNCMQKRLDNVQSVMNEMLNKDNMDAAINALHMLQEKTVTMDILNSTFAKNKRIGMLNFSNLKKVLPLV